jgi:hypothetical protein
MLSATSWNAKRGTERRPARPNAKKSAAHRHNRIAACPAAGKRQPRARKRCFEAGA